MVHNVLFDPPLPDGQRINVGNNTIIENIYSIYNLAVFKNIFRIYLTFLLIQYINEHMNQKKKAEDLGSFHELFTSSSV